MSLLGLARAGYRAALEAVRGVAEPPAPPHQPRRLRIPGLTATDALHRAASCVGQGRYVLGAGGRDPDAPAPWTRRGARYGSDCVGFVLWCWGLDRYQPATFPLYGGWINTDSALQSVRTSGQWFELVEGGRAVEPGDLLVFPSVDLDHDGSRDRIGHVGLVSHVPYLWDGDVGDLRVIHCAASGRVAVRESSGAPWAGRDAFRGRRDPRWQSRVLRVVRAG